MLRFRPPISCAGVRGPGPKLFGVMEWGKVFLPTARTHKPGFQSFEETACKTHSVHTKMLDICSILQKMLIAGTPTAYGDMQEHALNFCSIVRW